MYIIKLGQSYNADYVGTFENKNSAYQWLQDNDYSEKNCQVIKIHDKLDYLPNILGI